MNRWLTISSTGVMAASGKQGSLGWEFLGHCKVNNQNEGLEQEVKTRLIDKADPLSFYGKVEPNKRY